MSAHFKYELIAECKPEWSTSYIFINKKYQFNIYLCEKNSNKKRPNNNTNSNNNNNSETYEIKILCLDNDNKSLDPCEHSIFPSIINLNINRFSTFCVSINKLSMNHGDSEFGLKFSCNNTAIDCSIANNKFISVRVINYKFKLLSTPKQLMNDEYKFYKDVKPKTNFLCYDIGLYNSNNIICIPPRKVPIKCIIYFENGIISPNQKALNLKGINTIYNEPYKLNNNGKVTVPLRIEETSTKYENKKFVIKFIADYEKITSNLDIAPVVSQPFLVRTKINKYRIKNKEQKKKPGRKKKKLKTNNTKNENNSQKIIKSLPQLPFELPLQLPSMPPLFATAPGMNMIQIDGLCDDKNGLILPSLDNNNKKRRKRNGEEAGMNGINELPNKRQKITRRGPMTRSMTRWNNKNNILRDRSPTVSADSDSDNINRNESINNSNNMYVFNDRMNEKEFEEIIISTLRMLGETMGRREYFVSGHECHCYLKCLYCGSTAYPPGQRHIKHVKTCMLWILYQNITMCCNTNILAKAFDFNNSINVTNSKNNNSNNNSKDLVQLLNMPIPPKIPTIPPIPSIINSNNNKKKNTNTNNVSISDIRPYSQNNSSGSFSLIRQDKCNSFNGFIGPFNSLLLNSIPNSNTNNSNNSPNNSFTSFMPNYHTHTPIPPIFQMGNGSFNGSVSGTNNNIGYQSFPTNDNDVYGRSDSNASQPLNGILNGFPLNLLNGSNLSINSNDMKENDIKNNDNASNTASTSDQSSVKTQKV